MYSDRRLCSSSRGEQQGASNFFKLEKTKKDKLWDVPKCSDCAFICVFSDEEVGPKTAAATGAAELPKAGPR